MSQFCILINYYYEFNKYDSNFIPPTRFGCLEQFNKLHFRRYYRPPYLCIFNIYFITTR